MAAALGMQPCRRAAAGRLLQMSLPWTKRYGQGSSQPNKSHPHMKCLPCARRYSICTKPHLCPLMSSCPFRLNPHMGTLILEQSALSHLKMLEPVQLAWITVLLSWPHTPALHNCFIGIQGLVDLGTCELLLGCTAPFSSVKGHSAGC